MVAQRLGINIFSARIGACHGDELLLLFSNEIPLEPVENDEDAKAMEHMLKIFTDFAKSGNPTPDGPKWDR